MSDPSTGPDHAAFLRAALAHAVRLGGRELRLGPAGAVALDGLGRPVRLERGGEPALPDLVALGHVIDGRERWAFRRQAAEEIELHGLGTWAVRRLPEGGLVLRAKRPPAACLEALVEAEPESLSTLRALYRLPGIAMHLSCDGETRARELALALVAERRMLGLPTRPFLPDPPERTERPPAHDGTDTFDLPPAAGAPWSVEMRDRTPSGSGPARLGDGSRPPDGASRVLVTPNRHDHWVRFGSGPVDAGGRPVILMRVSIQASTARARLAFSPEALALATGTAPFADAPWDAYRARREIRRSARPAKPKTWHTTLDAVAKAFHARTAPRGLLSGNALYFHGPVAYALGDQNPIAAYVRSIDGKPLLIYARSAPHLRGSEAAGVRAVTVDALGPLVRLGGHALSDIPWRYGRDKSEHTLPHEAEMLPGPLADWIVQRRDALEAELDAAYATRYPTGRQSSAYRILAEHARTRDALCAALGLDLPCVGEASDLERRGKAASAAADRRQAELTARARLLREDVREEEPAPAGP